MSRCHVWTEAEGGGGGGEVQLELGMLGNACTPKGGRRDGAPVCPKGFLPGKSERMNQKITQRRQNVVVDGQYGREKETNPRLIEIKLEL